MRVRHQRLLWLWGGLLGGLLCLLFLPLTSGERGFAILMVSTATLAGLMLTGRKPAESDADEVNLSELPDAPYRLPIVLVCGDTESFPSVSSVYRSAEGCWLKVREDALQQTVRRLLWLRPEWVSQLAVMACVNPQQHEDNDTLTGRLLTLRWQMVQVRRDTRRSVPLLLTSSVAARIVTTPLWQTILPDTVAQLWQSDEAPISASTWFAQGEEATPRLRALVLLHAHTRFIGGSVLPVLSGDNSDMPAVAPSMVLYQQARGMTPYHESSLWQHFLTDHTTLVHADNWQPSASSPSEQALPDFILPFLPHSGGRTPRSRLLRRALCVFTLAALVALCSSGWNNRQLLHRVAFDVAQYNRIPMKAYAPKAKAVATLRKDAVLLNDWSRNGEPLRYGLGLYRGELLRPAVLAAIQSYVPAPPPPPPVIKNIIRTTGPQTVRLDSMSLFDVGHWQLKPGSTKVLINALVNIKAKAGWLIVVAGHTDNTGDDKSNQVLSLKRAESVRDWMRDTGDVPESCFAVQGYGESRPAQSNDTTEGRAANRRVEISLVPQADACQPTTASASKPISTSSPHTPVTLFNPKVEK